MVPERRATQYLLNPAHPAGGSKAWFFLRFGFTVAEWPKLADALLRLARENEVVETEQTPHGRRYVVDGRLIAPLLPTNAFWFTTTARTEWRALPFALAFQPRPGRNLCSIAFQNKSLTRPAATPHLMGGT